MRQVSCFKTKDGLIFETEEEAALHEHKLEFREWYECNGLYGRYEGSDVDIAMLDKWLKANADRVKVYIDALCYDR